MKDNSLWEYSLASYGKTGAEPLLLELQDRYGADINMILAACWFAAEGHLLTEKGVRSSNLKIVRWQRECVQPLRTARRFLKEQPEHHVFREQIKALELEAERIQQQILYSELGAVPVVADDSGFESLAARNLQVYCATLPGLDWRDMSETVLMLIGLLTE